MSPIETAEYLGIALGTLRNWTSARFIPFSKKGRIVRYNRTAIDARLAKGGCSGAHDACRFVSLVLYGHAAMVLPSL